MTRMMAQLLLTRDDGYRGWRHEDAGITNMHHDDEGDSDRDRHDHADDAVGGHRARRLSRLLSEGAVMT